MSKKLLSIAIKGKNHEWGLYFYGDPKNIEEWRKDGLDICVIENIVPQWIVDIGLVKLYIFLQDIFNLKNPFKNKQETITIVESDQTE